MIQETVTSVITSYIDVGAQQLVKVDETSNFDITLDSAALGAAGLTAQIRFVGKQTTTLEQQ